MKQLRDLINGDQLDSLILGYPKAEYDPSLPSIPIANELSRYATNLDTDSGRLSALAVGTGGTIVLRKNYQSGDKASTELSTASGTVYKTLWMYPPSSLFIVHGVGLFIQSAYSDTNAANIIVDVGFGRAGALDLGINRGSITSWAPLFPAPTWSKNADDIRMSWNSLDAEITASSSNLRDAFGGLSNTPTAGAGNAGFAVYGSTKVVHPGTASDRLTAKIQYSGATAAGVELNMTMFAVVSLLGSL